MKQERIVLKPKYYDKFACITSQCEQNCCAQGWKITIDKKTYQKYQSVKDPQLADRLRRSIELISSDKSNEYSYAQLKKLDDGRCAFQTLDGLCEIHRDFGEEFLCKTCRVYPRLAKTMTDEYTELSLSMSCPEAIRAALLETAPMEFVIDKMSFHESDPLLTNMPTPMENDGKTQYLAHGMSMREAACDIMQKQDCPIAYRIIVIAMMLNEVVSQSDRISHEDDIPALLEQYAGGAYGEEFVASFADVKHDAALSQKMYTLLYYNIVENAYKSPKSVFAELLQRFDKTLAPAPPAPPTPSTFPAPQPAPQTPPTHSASSAPPDDAMNTAEFYNFIKNKENAHWGQFAKGTPPEMPVAGGHIIENYMVNFMFSELFPLKYHHKGLNPYHHAFLLAEQYALLKMLLCGNYSAGTGFSERYITRTLSQAAVVAQHSDKLLKITEDFKTLSIDTPAHLYHLLL